MECLYIYGVSLKYGEFLYMYLWRVFIYVPVECFYLYKILSVSKYLNMECFHLCIMLSVFILKYGVFLNGFKYAMFLNMDYFYIYKYEVFIYT